MLHPSITSVKAPSMLLRLVAISRPSSRYIHLINRANTKDYAINLLNPCPLVCFTLIHTDTATTWTTKRRLNTISTPVQSLLITPFNSTTMLQHSKCGCDSLIFRSDRCETTKQNKVADCFKPNQVNDFCRQEKDRCSGSDVIASEYENMPRGLVANMTPTWSPSIKLCIWQHCIHYTVCLLILNACVLFIYVCPHCSWFFLKSLATSAFC